MKFVKGKKVNVGRIFCLLGKAKAGREKLPKKSKITSYFILNSRVGTN